MDKQSAVWRQMQQQLATGGAAAGGNAAVAGAGATATAPCRTSSARWTPTPEQVKILKDLYYDCGIRSPTAEQIQRIAARLRQYGRIEGKNVFYWFQNHKARERQKKRLGVDVNASPYPILAAHGDVLASSPSSAGSSAGLYHGAGGCGGRGAAVVHPDSSIATTTCWGDITMQEYMGGARSAGAGSQTGAATAPTPRPACLTPFSTNQTPQPPETLPLFPTGGAGQETTVHDFHHGDGYHLLQSNSQWWGAAAATATNSNAMTVHHHQLLQQQQQHSFYSNQQLMTMMPRPSQQDAGTSLELTLRAPYPAGSM